MASKVEKKIIKNTGPTPMISVYSIATVIGAWIAALFWIALVPPLGGGPQAAHETQEHLNLLEKTVLSFQQSQGRLPADWQEIRLWGRYQHMNGSPFDGFGQRMEYLRFNNQTFLLRSFGKDQLTNTLVTAPDIIVTGGMQRDLFGISQEFSDVFSPMEPNGLIGLISPDGKAMASIIADSKGTGQKRLVVQLPSEGILAIAPRQRVQEFLWHPNSHAVVFSAEDDAQLGTEVLVWDLLNNQVHNLLKKEDSLPLAPNTAPNTESIWATFGGIDAKGRLRVFHFPRDEQAELNPRELYREANLSVFEGENFSQSATPLAADEVIPAKISFMALASQQLTPSATQEQSNWLKLPRQGLAEQRITEWQEFLNKNRDSVLAPYLLWYLTVLYGQFAQQNDLEESTRQVLRAYGIEIAQALSQRDSAPSYLQAFARFHGRALSAKSPIDYQLAEEVAEASANGAQDPSGAATENPVPPGQNSENSPAASESQGPASHDIPSATPSADPKTPSKP